MGSMSAASASPKGYGQAMTTYRKAGWRGVLPLERGAKWPPPSDYTGASGQDPEGPKLIEWVSAYRNGNLALRLPRGVVGVDVDHYGSKRGAEALAELEARYGALPDTWSSTSRGVGPSRIHLFRCPEDLVLPGKLADSIEAIQFHHRYCVVWPSVVEGRQYAWYTPEGVVSGRPPRPNELAWLPEDWARVQKPERPKLENYQPRAVSGDWSQAVGRYHAEGVAGLGHAGGRHDSMLPVVMTLVRLDHDGHPGASEALDDLRGRFVVAIGDRSGAAEAEREWARMEAGAEAQVAVTPSLRGSYEDLKAKPLPSTPSAPPKPPIVLDVTEDEPVIELGEDTCPDGDEWAFLDPTAHLDGTYQRPDPTMLEFEL
jgi:hypothetical protein